MWKKLVQLWYTPKKSSYKMSGFPEYNQWHLLNPTLTDIYLTTIFMRPCQNFTLFFFIGIQLVKNASGQSQQPTTEEQWYSRGQTYVI